MRVPQASSWRRAAFAVAVFLGCAALGSAQAPPRGDGAGKAWYVPKEADFRPEFDRDAVNQRVQTWDQYWGWVTSFYSGNAFSAGWTRQGSADVAVVKSSATRRELVVRLNDLGKRISMEWAKDNGVRKVSTGDLSGWNAMINQARRAETGSGARLKAVLKSVDAEVTRKLGQ